MSTPLHFAAQRGDISEVRRLVALGTDVNIQDLNGNAPLKHAAAEPFPDTLRELILLGADPNLSDARGFTPLHCVASHGFYAEAIEMAEILIRAGADVNARSVSFGYVPLHEVRTIPMIDLLLKNGADAPIRNDAGLTPSEHLAEDDSPLESQYLYAKQAATTGRACRDR